MDRASKPPQIFPSKVQTCGGGEAGVWGSGGAAEEALALGCPEARRWAGRRQAGRRRRPTSTAAICAGERLTTKVTLSAATDRLSRLVRMLRSGRLSDRRGDPPASSSKVSCGAAGFAKHRRGERLEVAAAGDGWWLWAQQASERRTWSGCSNSAVLPPYRPMRYCGSFPTGRQREGRQRGPQGQEMLCSCWPWPPFVSDVPSL